MSDMKNFVGIVSAITTLVSAVIIIMITLSVGVITNVVDSSDAKWHNVDDMLIVLQNALLIFFISYPTLKALED